MIAGTIVVIPLYAIALIMGFLAARVGTTWIYGQASGVYDHYFDTFLNTKDLAWSFFQTIAMIVVVMLVSTYYGYTASGGPAGSARPSAGRCGLHGGGRVRVGRGDTCGLRPVRQLPPRRITRWNPDPVNSA